MRAGDTDQPQVTGPAVAGIPYHYVALGLVGFGVIINTIDSSVVNIALPTLAAEFDTSVSSVIWVSLVFILVSVGLALTMGRLGDLYGRRRLYVAGFALFTVSTSIAAVSNSLEMLLAARIVQGVASSMVVANAVAIVTSSFPASRRGQALGMLLGAVGTGLAMGPVFGGVMIEALDWRAIFWTRIPLGAIEAVLVWKFLRDPPAEQRPKGLDLTGSVLLFGLLFSLILGINRGDSWGWTSPAVLALFLISAVSLVIFLGVERRSPSPVLALDLFRRWGFSAAITSAVLQFAGMASVLVLLPFFLIEARGLSTMEAGMVMAAMPLTMLVVGPIAGTLSDRVGPRPLTTTALVIAATGLLWLSTIRADTSLAQIVVQLILIGIGTGMFSSPNTSAVMGSVTPDRLGTASASTTTARQIGQSIGIAIATAIFSAQAAAFALARSPLGLDDLAIKPAALTSGLELALIVAASITALGILTSVSRGRLPAAEPSELAPCTVASPGMAQVETPPGPAADD